MAPGDAGKTTGDLGVGGNGGGTEIRADGGQGGSTSPGFSLTNTNTKGGDSRPGGSGGTIPSSSGGVILTAGQQATTTALTGGASVIGTPPITGGAGRMVSAGSIVGGTAIVGGTTIVGGRSAGGVATGGSLGAGGTTALGSSTGAGTATGGSLGAGGTTALGGGTASGGSGGTSTSSSSNPPPKGDVTFSFGIAQGFMTGYGWVDLAPQETLTSPTCEGAPITSTKACNGTTIWSSPDALCMSGSIPALPASPTQADYDNNWGMNIVVNANEPSDVIGSVIDAFGTVAFTFSGAPSTGVRAFVHRRGASRWTDYCFDGIKSGQAVSLTKFNTKCWGDITTIYLEPADLPDIDQIGIGVPSRTSPITVSNFCLERISFM